MFSYFGGKYKQSKWMYNLFPNKFDNYAEVFGGAMWLYFKTPFIPDKAFYNDKSLFTYNIFSCFKQHDDFLNYLYKEYKNLTFLDLDFMKESIDLHKENFKVPNYDMAIRTLYILKHTFTQSFKHVNQIKPYDKFFGWTDELIKKNKKKRFCDLKTFIELKKNFIKNKLSNLEVFNCDYKDFIKYLISENYKNLFLYIDPPYFVSTQKYEYDKSFTKKNHLELANVLKKIKDKWMLSYYYFDGINDLYEGYNFFYKEYCVNISYNHSNKKSGTTKIEIVITNYIPKNNLLTI